MKTRIATRLNESVRAKQNFAKAAADNILLLANWIQECFTQGGTLFIFGNGGSAADAQHMAAEFVNRFLINRRPLPAMALTTDTSILTAVGNDFSFDLVFAKQIEAFGRPRDMALGISTSGNSGNVIKAMEAAGKIGMRRAALTGGIQQPGGKLAACCDLLLNVPTEATPHIQECHLWVEHLLCEIVEEQMFGKKTETSV